ncbi:MAG: CU044_5270 family protein [Streptosporangiaceae bacterium]
MTDLEMVTGLRPEIPLRPLDSLGPARERLFAAIAAERADARPAGGTPAPDGPADVGRGPAPTLAPLPARTPRPRGRARWGARRRLALAGLAISVAAGATLLVTARGPGAPAMVPPRIDAVSAHVLDLAAAAARRQPGGPPRPDQFIYHAIRDGGGHLYQSWLSVDGTRTGLARGIGGGTWAYLPGCRDGRDRVNASVLHGGTNGWEHCTPTPAYLPGMPTSASAMGGYLKRTQGVTLGDTVAEVDMLGGTINDLLMSTYLAPRQLAAVYDFLASTPGFTVVPDAVDAVGRHGVGIRWQVSDGQAIAPGDTAMIIFNPRTGAYMGGRTTYLGEGPRNYSGDAIVKLAVVNRIGQLP